MIYDPPIIWKHKTTGEEINIIERKYRHTRNEGYFEYVDSNGHTYTRDYLTGCSVKLAPSKVSA